MSNANRITGMILSAGMALAAMPVMGADAASELKLEPRETARWMAQIEKAMEKRDLKGYCAVTSGAPDYAGYVALACLERVERKLKKPEDCSLANIRGEVKKDHDQCLAMSTTQFEKRASEQARGREAWIKEVKKQGVDGEKLLQEARAKLR